MTFSMILIQSRVPAGDVKVFLYVGNGDPRYVNKVDRYTVVESGREMFSGADLLAATDIYKRLIGL